MNFLFTLLFASNVFGAGFSGFQSSYNNITVNNSTVSGSTIIANDNVFTLQDNTTPTKKAQFELSGITAGQTRVLTVPDSNMTLAATNVAQTYTAIPNLNAGLTASGTITVNGPMTLSSTGQFNGPTNFTNAVNLVNGQLGFPSTQNPSSNANTFDDYEEGTITPTIVSCGAGSVPTYTSSGTYTYAGRIVVVNINIKITAIGTCSGTITLGSAIPVASSENISVCFRESDTVGSAMCMDVSATGGTIYRYDNTSVAGNGYRYKLTMVYSR